MNYKRYDEMNISQIPALEVLENMGYQVIRESESTYVYNDLRESMYSVLLKPVLKQQLKKINSYEFKGQIHTFSDVNVEQALNDIDMALTDGLIKTNEKIYDTLILGKSYEERISEEDGSRSFNLYYIDFDNPENNVFHAIEEYSVETESGDSTARPDIVLFVNGIPFGVIECKKASISTSQGISQMIRNQGQTYIPNLFKFVLIVMATNKNETKYATVGTPSKFWSFWKEDKESEEYAWYKQELSNSVINRIPTIQDQNLVSMFHPKRALELIRYFILFDRKQKKITRYQQYFAVKEIMSTIQETDEEGNRQSGVIWHTQGSGKSLTMVMLAKYILHELAKVHPQLLIITDRIELDSQIHKTFTHSRLRAARATSGKNLVQLIKDNKADIITSLVHKFDTASKNQKPIKNQNVFVLVDESHRTQYGELHIKMKQVFPNACYLGFTGTPLMKKEKSTMRKFGRMIHKYTIKDGVNDGTIVPLLYEGRYVEQSVNRNAIDKQLEMITRNLNEKQSIILKQKWAKFENIASSEQRIRLIADDIYVHFNTFYRGKNRTPFNAMLATNSKFDAIRYQEAFEEYPDIKTAVVISPPDQREGYEELDQEPKDRVLKFWNKMMQGYSDSQQYDDHIKNEFVYGDNVDILIVVDKLLTGFDAPRASVLYIDKPMKDHSLLQAIARVNRIYDGKDYGMIVDYRGLIEELDSALETYSGAGLENFDTSDIQGALVDVIQIVGKLREAYSQVIDIFRNVKNQRDREEYEIALEDDEKRNQFYNALSAFGKYMAIALESEHVYEALGNDEISTYKREFKYFQELRAAVKLRYSDTIDHKEYEARMRNLMDTYIAAEDVMVVTAPVDILNKGEFDEELNKLGSSRAKADAIRTRMIRRIHQKYDENPSYYKKFSDRIQEILDEYKEKRVSDADYFTRMNKVLSDFRQGYTGTTYPHKIKHHVHAQAFYGVVKDALDIISEFATKYDEETYEDLLSDLALEIDDVIEKNSKVDWHDNPDVHNRITIDLNDLFYQFKKQYFPKLSFTIIDEIIGTIKTVALRRY
jgi:type I restriction enzyme R subunit